MADFPNLLSGQPTMVPAVITQRRTTVIQKFCDNTEQRFATGNAFGLGVFTLSYTGINGYDLSVFRQFFNSVKGRFDATWTLTINGVMYTNCAFAHDTFAVLEAAPNIFNLTLAVVQTNN